MFQVLLEFLSLGLQRLRVIFAGFMKVCAVTCSIVVRETVGLVGCRRVAYTSPLPWIVAEIAVKDIMDRSWGGTTKFLY